MESMTYYQSSASCIKNTPDAYCRQGSSVCSICSFNWNMENRLKETLLELREEFHQVSGREKEELDQKLQILLQTQYKHPLISTYYFTPDARKQGGHYEKKTEYVKRIDPVKEYIIMKDDTIIRFHYIKELQGEIFNKVIVG